MRRLHVGSHFTVFLLFFGLALIEALQSANWLVVLFWVAIAMVFLWGARRDEHSNGPSRR